jgi:predicted permease
LASLRLSAARESEIVEELAQHLDDRWRELVSGGVSEDEATKLALGGFREGDLLARHLEPLRQAHAPEPIAPGAPAGRLWAGLYTDLKYVVRSITGAKKFAAIVVATLALGIGANSAVFGVLNAVVLRPLPYDEPDRLVRVYAWDNGIDGYLPGPVVVALRESSRTLDIAALYTYSAEGADLTDRGQPERVRTLRVSADYFRVLRVSPALGRFFERTDERRDARVAVVSARVWRDHLGGAVDAPGRMLSLNGVPHHITGVLPEGFEDPLQPGVDVWTTVNLQPDGGSNSWGNSYLSSIARLRPGATLEQAQAELATIAAGLGWNGAGNRQQRLAHVVPLQADTIGSAGGTLWILLGAVTLLLLIACVNVASLFLARGAARESELAVRTALGCSRWRLTRQLLVESLLLSITGGLAGLGLARLVTRVLLTAAPETVVRYTDGTIEGAVFVFGLGIAMLAGIGFGVAPMWQRTRGSLEGLLRESGRGGSGSRRHTHARNVLVVCQIALALMLLIGAGLLLRSFDRLRSVALGIQPANVLTFEVNLPIGRYQDPLSRARFHRDFLARLEALPGVRAAAAVSRLPVTGPYHTWLTRRLDLPPGSRDAVPDQRVIEGRYFEALRIPLLRGRTFNDRDDEQAPRRVVISQAAARVLFGDEEPIGRHLYATGDAPDVEIIGIVADVAVSPRGAVNPMVYHSHRQFAANRNWGLSQVVAFDRPVPPRLDEMRRELAAIDPALVLARPRMLTEVVGLGIAQERFALILVGSFAGLALALAAVGIYGVLSYNVQRRRREMGIRMALGAPGGAVRALIVRDGGRLAIVGVVFGLVGAYAAAHALQVLLFSVTTTDPIVFATCAAAVALVALAASWIPARAATKVNPLDAVRTDV